MAVMDINVFSVMLRHGMDVTVVLPDDIDDEEQLNVYGCIMVEAVITQNGCIIQHLLIQLRKDILQQFFRMLMSPALLI